MMHKIELTDEEFAIIRAALKDLALVWSNPSDPILTSLLTNKFSVTMLWRKEK